MTCNDCDDCDGYEDNCTSAEVAEVGEHTLRAAEAIRNGVDFASGTALVIANRALMCATGSASALHRDEALAEPVAHNPSNHH